MDAPSADRYRQLLERVARLDSLLEQLLRHEGRRQPSTRTARRVPPPTSSEKPKSYGCLSRGAPIPKLALSFAFAPASFGTTSSESIGSWE